MNEIEVITNVSRDWEVIKLNGETYEEGHSIPSHTWLNLIEQLGNKTTIKEISDEDMEYGNY